MLRHTTLCAFFVVIMAMGAYAQAGDCDSLRGQDRAFGLCNAYCEAKNCDSPENKDSPSCKQLYHNFEKVSSESMPCDGSFSPGSQLGSCPCNLDLQSRTTQFQSLLSSKDRPMCNGTLDGCITCDLSASVPGSSFTLLLITLNSWDNGMSSSSEQDTLFFLTDGGACLVDVSFEALEQQPVNSEQFQACVSDIKALESAYTMCSR